MSAWSRLGLGGSSNKTPKPHINENIANLDIRIGEHDVKIAKIDGELAPVLKRLNLYRQNKRPPPKKLKEQALKIMDKKKRALVQKEQVEAQREQLESARNMSDSLQNVMTTVDTLKTTTKTLKKQYGKIDIDKIEQLQDEMADLMEMGNEINDSISRAYDVPEGIDEEELDAELEAMSEDIMYGQETGIGEEPGFLQDEVAPTFIDEPPEQSKVKEAAGGVG